MGTKDSSRKTAPPDEGDPAESELDEDQEKDQGEGATQKNGKGRFRRLTASMTRRKWLKGAVVGLLIFGMGLGITQGKKLIPASLMNPPDLLSDKGHKQDYYEEKLPSFFIPLPPEGENQAVMIRFSVIWNGLTSFRYRSLELRIRNRIYGHIKGVAREQNNLQEKTSLLESEMSNIFRESLGLEDLAVKIKEIKTI